MPRMLEQSLATFVEEVSARTPAPGGGAVAAISVGMSASLVGMAARFSDEYFDAAYDLAEKADVLRDEVVQLAQADGEAYSELLRAYRIPRDDPGQDEAIAEAAQEAARIPLEISAYAGEVALLAARLADEGNPNLNGDAVAAALLASAAARACANLVRINLDDTAEEFGTAAGHARAAEAAAGRALSARR